MTVHIRPGAFVLSMAALWAFPLLDLVAPATSHGASSGSVQQQPTSSDLETVVECHLLEQSWQRYSERFIQGDGRIIDFNNNSVSTSEGQAYALLRAAWMLDRDTFDRVLAWADNNLNKNVRDDHLFAWKWGPRDDGSWGVYDATSAADADQLIAYALVLAHQLWADETYKSRAKTLLDDIWTKQTRLANGVRFLLAGDWPPLGARLRINPSYYVPFVYRTFSQFDPSHQWATLIDSSYRVFRACRSRLGLPTDWCDVNPSSGEITYPVALSDRAADFGYEAFRVIWNLASDALWYDEARAFALLKDMEWLNRFWHLRNEIPAVVTVDGIPLVSHDYLGMYGAYLPALAIVDPEQAKLLYKRKIQPSFHKGIWGNPNDYYAQNWVWFGLFLKCRSAGMNITPDASAPNR